MSNSLAIPSPEDNTNAPYSERTIFFGNKLLGRKFKDVPVDRLRSYIEWVENTYRKSFTYDPDNQSTREARQFLSDAKNYLYELSQQGNTNENPSQN